MKILKFAFLGFFSLQSLWAAEPISKEMNVTIYNQNFGIVREMRELELKKDYNLVEIRNVASSMDSTTVKVKFDGKVGEQNYRYDLANLDAILNKYIDKEITLMSKDGLDEYKGTLISSNFSNIVLQNEKGELLMFPNSNDFLIKTSSLPEGLITKPTLVWDLYSNKAGKQEVELSYKTDGLSWHAEYVATLNNDDTKMDLNAWVSIDNNSGATYKNANLKLVAGDVNMAGPVNPAAADLSGNYPTFFTKESYRVAPQFSENPFFEYHIYELSDKTNILNKENKQISLFETKDIIVKKKYKYISNGYSNGNEKVNPFVEISFINSKENKLGMPIPQGKVRLNKSDGKAVEFIGEDNIKHTAKDEEIELKLGKAFDLTVKETLLENERLSDTKSEQTIEIEVNNRKEKDDATIIVTRNLYGNWEVRKSSLPFRKKDANTIEFDVKVKAGQSEKLTYTVRMGY